MKKRTERIYNHTLKELPLVEEEICTGKQEDPESEIDSLITYFKYLKKQGMTNVKWTASEECGQIYDIGVIPFIWHTETTKECELRRIREAEARKLQAVNARSRKLKEYKRLQEELGLGGGNEKDM